MPVPLNKTAALGEVTAAIVYGKRIKEASGAIEALFKEAKMEKVPAMALVYVIAAAIQGGQPGAALDPNSPEFKEILNAVAAIAAQKIAPNQGMILPQDIGARAQEILQGVASSYPALASRLPASEKAGEMLAALARRPDFQQALKKHMDTAADVGDWVTRVQTHGPFANQQPARA